VGFRGLRRRVTIRSPLGPLQLDLVVDALVDLEPSRRGAHLSRNVEALIEAALEAGEAPSLEEYLDSIAERLLEKHGYASRAWVRARMTYHVPIELPEAGVSGVEPVEVEVSVSKPRGGRSLWRVQVALAGMSVCPSAASTTSSMLGTPRDLSPSHAQRVIVRGALTTRGRMVRIESIARALSRAPSAPAFTLLKRLEEGRLVLYAFRNQKLAEDIARDALCGLARLAARCCPDALVEVEVESLESIHPHNVYVRRASMASAIAPSCGEAGPGG
jgi:GTP cyclohydrolase-4